MLARSSLVVILITIASAGCTNAPSGASGHCHADHVQSLDVSNGPWASQAAGSPREDNGARIYTWAIHRTGACSDPVGIDAQMYVVPPEIGCGGTDLAAAALTGTMTIDDHAETSNASRLATRNASQDWEFGQQYEHDSVDSAKPQAWNFTLDYRVPHDPLAIVSGVDDCVKKAILHLKLEGNDWDFLK